MFTYEYLEKQVDALDASLFSGDAFFDKMNRALFRKMIARWERELKRLDEAEAEDEDEATV